MKTLRELREEITAKQASLAEIFKEAGPNLDFSKITRITGTTEEKVAEVNRRNQELNDLVRKAEERELVERTHGESQQREEWLSEVPEPLGHPGASAKSRVQKKSIGELFVESRAYREFKGGTGPAVDIEVEVKTLFQTTAGWAPEAVRGPRVELTPERSLVVGDLPSTTETSQNAVKFMEETTKTPAAVEVAEAGTYPEAAFVLTERSSPVQKIAVFIPVTDEQFEDEPRARDYINNRLTRAVQERFDLQLLVGNGTPPNLKGVLNVAGINTYAKAAGEPIFDAVYKGITLNRFTGFAEPDAIILHPNDWQDIRLTRTADGVYLIGNPGEPGVERLFGFRVVVTPALTENTGLIGSFRAYSEIAFRSGLQVQVSNSHSDYFIKGQLAVRADFRAAFLVYRPKAFTTITSI